MFQKGVFAKRNENSGCLFLNTSHNLDGGQLFHQHHLPCVSIAVGFRVKKYNNYLTSARRNAQNAPIASTMFQKRRPAISTAES